MASQRRRQFVRSISAGAAVGFTGLAGCLGDNTVAKTQEVQLTNDGFDPRNIKVDRQKTVYWENVSDTRYVLASATSTWNFRQPLDPGMTTGFQFTNSGIYRLVARESEGGGEETPSTPETPTGTPEFTGTRMKIAVGRELEDPITE